MTVKVIGGEKVKILTSGGEIDPNIYNVQSVKQDLISLLNKETGVTIKVNDKRIYKILKECQMSKTTLKSSDIIVEPELNKPKVKTPVNQEKIDFDQMVNDGFEVWTKEGLSLGKDPKVSKIAVSAHCIIDPENVENRGYEIFNSYNGTRGAKGKGGKRYLFTDKMTVDKKRKVLQKKGYMRHKV